MYELSTNWVLQLLALNQKQDGILSFKFAAVLVSFVAFSSPRTNNRYNSTHLRLRNRLHIGLLVKKLHQKERKGYDERLWDCQKSILDDYDYLEKDTAVTDLHYTYMAMRRIENQTTIKPFTSKSQIFIIHNGNALVWSLNWQIYGSDLLYILLLQIRLTHTVYHFPIWKIHGEKKILFKGGWDAPAFWKYVRILHFGKEQHWGTVEANV